MTRRTHILSCVAIVVAAYPLHAASDDTGVVVALQRGRNRSVTAASEALASRLRAALASRGVRTPAALPDTPPLEASISSGVTADAQFFIGVQALGGECRTVMSPEPVAPPNQLPEGDGDFHALGTWVKQFTASQRSARSAALAKRLSSTLPPCNVAAGELERHLLASAPGVTVVVWSGQSDKATAEDLARSIHSFLLDGER